MPTLEAHELSHAYGAFQVLEPLELELNEGEIVALRGPNGSGKSTLLLCLSGLLRPATGAVLACGHDLYTDEPEARRCLAFVPDVPRFYLELTAWEHLRFMAQAHGVSDGFEQRARELLTEFGLWAERDMFPQSFSRGMRLKLGLVLALIRPFKVLLLDEPTSALDADATRLVGRTLADLRHQGASLLVSTHDPDLSGRLADRALTIQNGQLAPAV